ncbi:hypothetical protein [Mycolicibacterium aubagnense]|uniref:hypothetical protein n=1 Tax=Mycolicibacterium aubagnense TaxID=319707 RepID=UPI001F32BCB3|nr:hypothetical protein [Mycolicibacterium aubagnense]
MKTHRLWLVVAIAASSLVLGLGATAIAYRTGPGARPIPPASAGPTGWPPTAGIRAARECGVGARR